MSLISHWRVVFPLLLIGCGSDDRAPPATGCEPGEVRACTCPGGAPGEQTCNADGSLLEDCRCEDSSDPDPPSSPFPAVADFAGPGSFPTSRNQEGPECEVFRPANLGEGGLLHPIIVWGNGTFVTPDAYWQVLDHWATHGFFVIAASTSNAGTGAEMIACLDYAVATYAGQVDPEKIGTSGHSQGGGGSIMAGRDPRVKATVPLQPFVTGLGHDTASQSQQNGPMLLFSGTEDTWAPVSHQQTVFGNSNVPTFWANRVGADHIVSATNDISEYRAPATAWFRLHLMADESGRDWFYGSDCDLCGDPGWIVQRKDL
jgi:hypothetical protein